MTEAPAATIAPVDPPPNADTPPVEQTATAALADSGTSDIWPLAGLLAALGLGGIALFATRRRHRAGDERTPEIVAYEPAAVVTPRMAPTPAIASAAPAMALQRSSQDSRSTWQEPRRTTAIGTAATVDNRQALLDRMVAAEPDANNPFTSAKARRRRTRLMLQSMDDQRWDDTELESGFDWREQARATRETVSA